MTQSLEPVLAPLRQLVETGRVPGLALAVQRGEAPMERFVFGADALGTPLATESLFIVASITKMATALAVLRLIDQGQLALDDSLGDHIPAAIAAQQNVTVRSLLCHTSGLPTDVAPEHAPYEHGLTWAKLGEACLLTPLEVKPWTQVQYSNVGYGLLALMVEERTGLVFAQALQQLVLEPLEIEGYLGDQPPRSVAVLADLRGDRARDPELAPFNSPFYRSLALPWAGLITTVDGALRIVRAFTGPAEFLHETTRREATSDQTRGLSGGFVPPLRWNPCPWALGPEVRGRKEPHWTPASASPASFGHSGASGCVAWHDPEKNVSWALIGTRTAENGWLLRRGSEIAAAILAAT